MDDGQPARKRRKRGGQRQRMAARSSARTGGASQLAAYLLGMVAWGIFSPQRARHISALACKDIDSVKENDSSLDDLYFLAGLGSDGAHSHNMHRELFTHYRTESLLPQPFITKMNFGAGLGEQTQAILLPHEMFANIYHHYKPTWNRTVLPNTNRLQEFWSFMDSHPQMLHHPIQQKTNYRTHAIPIAVHGDEVPITGLGKGWVKLMCMFSWSSLVGVGSTLDMQIWIWSVFTKLLATGACSTMDQFFKILAWSFNIMFTGKYPALNYDDTPNFVLCSATLYMF